MLKDSFSLFSFLIKFRDIFKSILSSLNIGPLSEEDLGKVLRRLNEQLGKESKEDIPQFLERCEKAVSEFEKKLLQTRERWNGLPLYGLRQMFRILSLICQGPFGFAGIVGEDGKAPLIKFHSLDPAVRFRDAWHDLKPPILASATLSPVRDVAEVLGLNQGIKAKISPVFPSQNYQSYAFLGCHSSPSENSDLEIFNKLEKKIIKESIAKILKATRRHTGLFCASHNVLTAMLRQLTRDIINKIGMHLLIARSDGHTVDDDFDILRQKCPAQLLKGMGEFDARLKLYMELAGNVPILLAGVTGGGLGEGVDFRGHTMEMAIIVGIPYQDEGDNAWVNDRRTKFFKMRTGETEIGKDLAYRQSALRKIAQTAGRVHRTMKDKGVIIFFDERLLGLKNNGSSGFARYEVLSANNTKKHWEIMQTRIFEKLSVVIPSKFDKQEANDLSTYIERTFKEKNLKPEIITSDHMIHSLMRFYNG
jgi:Rad3-related DNA helicase